MNRHWTTPIAITTLAVVALLGAVAAQADPWLELDLTDEAGRTWTVRDDGAELAIGADEATGRFGLRARPLAAGIASLAFALDGQRVAIADVPAPSPREVVATVADGADDAEQFLEASRADGVRWPRGYTYTSSSDLEFGLDPDHARQLVAVRFRDLDVPAHADLERVELRFTARGDSDGALSLTIYGTAVDRAARWTQDPDEAGGAGLSALDRTLAAVPWTPATAWRDGDPIATPDLAPLVQELRDRNPGEALTELAFVIEASSGDGFRRAHAYDGERGEPRLHPTLVVTLREPALVDAGALEIPGGSVLTVTAHREPGGGGAAIATLSVTVGRAATVDVPPAGGPDTEPAAEPEPEPTPEPAPEPTPAPAPEATPPTAPADAPAPPLTPAPEPTPAPTTPAAPLATARIWFVDVTAGRDGASLVTVVLEQAVAEDVTPVIRAGTCAAPGAVVGPLRPIPAGEPGSTTEVPVSPSTLALAGFIVVLEGVPDVCAPLGR